MFAAITFEREPLTLADIPANLAFYVQVVGGFAAFGLLLWLLIGLPRWRPEDRATVPAWQRQLFFLCVILTYTGYLGGLAALLFGIRDLIAAVPGQARPNIVAQVLLTLGGAAAIVAVGLPFAVNLASARFRRIFALAKLSFKEALRRRVLYAFCLVLLVFLFGSWFVPTKPADEVRTYVGIVFFVMTYILLIVAALVSAFSIPADIRQQTIHTIVTKPVERFEIVLGRILGFLALMTLVLVVMTGISLLYVLRSVHPHAAAESLKAREPLYGQLTFENTDSEKKGINVGREWDYRGYITKMGRDLPQQAARWDLKDLPASLAQRDKVRCEYSFDVYRTTKGDEGRGVNCEFKFTTWRYEPGNDEAFRKRRAKGEEPGQLAEELGYFELTLPVTDYTTQAFDVPGGLFKNARTADSDRAARLKRFGPLPPPVQLRVHSISPTQYVGMARHDFYVRLDQPGAGEQWLFGLNFFKAAFGVWMQLAVVISLAVTLSTYLTGVVSLLATCFLYAVGLMREFVTSVATGTNPGGGPMEALLRLSRRDLTGPSMAESTSTTERLAGGSDYVFRFAINVVKYLLPDVQRFDLTAYVAEGFNISVSQVGADFLLMAGYLLPWAILGFYLIRWREVASSS